MPFILRSSQKNQVKTTFLLKPHSCLTSFPSLSYSLPSFHASPRTLSPKVTCTWICTWGLPPRERKFTIAALMFLSANSLIGVISGSVSTSWFFSWLWIVFPYFDACVESFALLWDLVNCMLLGTGFVAILVFCFFVFPFSKGPESCAIIQGLKPLCHSLPRFLAF